VVRGVLFDLDDTLVDLAGAARAAIRVHLADLGRPHGEDVAVRWREVEDRHFGRFLAGELGFQEQRRERVREMLGERLDDDAADAWFAAYTRRLEAEFTTFDDVVTALELVATRRLPVGIVTNLDADLQRRKLELVGLGDRFEVLVGLDAIGRGKPDPAVFRHACELLGTAPADTVFVGDRLDHDALGARDAGLRAVWLDRSGRTGPDVAEVPGGVARITSLRELEQVLA
jgi:putative hydrolase of the HAD superfamily